MKTVGGTVIPNRDTRLAQLAGTILLVAALGVVMGTSTRSAYSDAAANSMNDFAAGSVAVGDNDSGNLMLALNDAKPGASTQACITVTYSGSLPASMRLYGTTSGTGLDAYLNLVVTRGSFTSGTPGFASCTDFVPDPVDHIGRGNGVVYDGTLAAYPDSYGAGLVDPVGGSAEQWSPSESHVYKVTVTLEDDRSAESKTAAQSFTWETRNS